MQAFGVDSHIHANDLVGAGAGFREDLASKEGSSIGGNVPTVLEKEPLEVVHLLTHPFTGAQTLETQSNRCQFGLAHVSGEHEKRRIL